MSKFIEKVQAKLTGQEVAVIPELSVTVDVDPLPFPDDRMKQYDIGVEWKVRTHCTPDALEHVLGNVVRQLREEIYGQFRWRVLQIQRCAYERDGDKLHMHIRDLLREIYGHPI